MDYIWTPWRYRYIADAGKIAGCVFCEAAAANRDVETLIVLRGMKNYVILNRYPYTSGHVLIVPYAHTADFGQLDPETSAEIMRLGHRRPFAYASTASMDGRHQLHVYDRRDAPRTGRPCYDVCKASPRARFMISMLASFL